MTSTNNIQSPTLRRAAVIGMFDGVHRGHDFLLQLLKREAAKRNLRPAVFTFPHHPLETINPQIAPQLICQPQEKLNLLCNAGILPDDINLMAFDGNLRKQTTAEFLSKLHNDFSVDFILRGFNNRFGTERDLTSTRYRQIAADCGIELIDAPGFELTVGNEQIAVSSSLIRKALSDGNITLANEMLGHPFELTGEVVTGKQIGRTIGFPTANLRPLSPSKIIPGNGVYACLATIDNHVHKAMVNIGNRPTIDGANSNLTIEAYMLNFSGDIYDRQLRLQFFGLLRRERKFSSPQELAEQLTTDRITTENFVFPL